MNIETKLKRLLRQSALMKQRMVKSLLKTMRKIDQERKARVADLDEAARAIAKELAELGHKFVDGAKSRRGRKAPKASKGKRRVRRSPQQLKTEATKVLAMVRSAGKDGVGGGTIRKSFSGVGQNIKSFVEKKTGAKIKTTGAKASMRYHA